MDLFDKKTEGKEEDAYIHEQLSLDFDASSKPVPSAEKKDISEADNSEKKLKVNKPRKKKKKKASKDLQDGHLALGVGSFGKFLQDMRFRNDYSISQVEQLTKIKAEYIELLEMEKLRFELPSVYILAYARKLCSCYNVPEHEISAIANELKEKLDDSLPDDLIENINIDYEIDEESQKKIRHFAWLLLGALIFFVALVGLAVFILSGPSKPKKVIHPVAQVENFDNEKLKVLQSPVIIEATELPAKQ